VSQQNLFGGARRAFVINVDGASRGNPGNAAAGWLIRDKTDGQVIVEEGLYLGTETNNRAEYFALLFALEDAHVLSADEVVVRSDSELLVKQMRGEYRVKNRDLKPIFTRARRMADAFGAFTIQHVPREENRDADRAANAALDAEKKQSS
jgi:ribonuclease HI